MSFIEIIDHFAIPLLTLLTVVLLYYYTRETYLLRKESQKQTQSQFTPYLSLRNLESGATFSNLGKGVALHIQFEQSIKVSTQPILIIPSIGSGEDRGIYQMSSSGDGAYSLSARELPDTVSITYLDIIGNKYEASFLKEYKGMGVFKEVRQTKL